MKKISLFMAILTSTLNVSAECLWRNEPINPDLIPVADFVHPDKDSIYIVSEKNKICAMGSSCFVSTGDKLLIQKSSSSYDLTWTHVSNNTQTKIPMARVNRSGYQPSYLKGKIGLDSYYLLFMANQKCADNLIPKPTPSDLCNHYRFEIHPGNIGGFVKPDHDVKDKQNIEWKEGCSLPIQPGGGNGNDPP